MQFVLTIENISAVDIDDMEVTHAGLALIAADTGRVLMLQRALDEDDPAAGAWELPGGGRDDGETTLDAAVREFAEEVGADLNRLAAEVVIVDAWTAPSGMWHGFVGVVPTEQSVPINLPLMDRDIDNPDESASSNPDEVVAWFDIDDLPSMPALREEVRSTPWDLLRSATAPQEASAMTTTEPSTHITIGGQTFAGTFAFDTLDPTLAELLQTVGTLPAAAAPDEIDSIELEDTDAEWESLLVVEGVPTGDGRFIQVGALTNRDLPLDLFAMFRDPDGGAGHAAAEIVGRIDSIEFRDAGPGRREVWGRGIYDTGEPAGARVARLNKKGMLKGVSVDLTDVTAEFNLIAERDVVTSAAIGRATVCSLPAFAEANIRLTGTVKAAMTEMFGCSPCAAAREEAQAKLDAQMQAAADDGPCCDDCANGALSADPSEWDLFDTLEVQDFEALVASGGTALVPQARVWTPFTEPESLVASGGAPAKPPLAWFQLADVRPVRPVRIHSDGRVDGYAALWGSCHVGFADKCIPVPRAGTKGYTAFHRGQVLTAEGTVIATGPIIMGPEHVARESHHTIPQVQDAYAAVGCRVADVVLYEDSVGLWVTGAAKPEISPADVRSFNAADGVSPHWMPPRHGRQLATLLVVNYSGFEVPNGALVASGGLQTSISDGEVGALVGHNPGFEDTAALRAELERLSGQVESFEPVLAFARRQMAEMEASAAIAEAEQVLALLDNLTEGAV